MSVSIAVIGECMLELTHGNPAEQGVARSMSMSYGGDTINTSIYLSRANVDVSYVTALGDDSMSDWLLKAWVNEDIDCSLVTRMDNSVPGMYMINVADDGERSFLYWRNNSPDSRLFENPDQVAILLQSMVEYEYLYLSGISLAILDSESRQRLFGLLEKYRKQGGKLVKPERLPNGLFRFKDNTGFDRVVLDCVTSLKHGADLLWIETEKPHVGQIAEMVNAIREQVPNAKLVYNNSPSFNWTLNFRQQVFDAWTEAGKDVSGYDRAKLMSADYDDSELAAEADEKIKSFQADAAREAGIFHHLITLPTYHTAALSTDNLAKGYFGEEGMLAYVRGVQRQEIRQGLACVKHQAMAGSDLGDTHKEYFSGEGALKASGEDNTMNQFDV